MGEEKKAKYEQACSTAAEFTELYYDRMDTKRHLIGKLYLDTASAFWNGNKIDGKKQQGIHFI